MPRMVWVAAVGAPFALHTLSVYIGQFIKIRTRLLHHPGFAAVFPPPIFTTADPLRWSLSPIGIEELQGRGAGAAGKGRTGGGPPPPHLGGGASAFTVAGKPSHRDLRWRRDPGARRVPARTFLSPRNATIWAEIGGFCPKRGRFRESGTDRSFRAFWVPGGTGTRRLGPRGSRQRRGG